MTVQKISDALENCISGNSNYSELVHNLMELECSDELITAIVVGSLGETLRDRVAPLIAMVRSYESLSSSEQIDLLYSLINGHDDHMQIDALKKRTTAQ
jgi:hypothetical protein